MLQRLAGWGIIACRRKPFALTIHTTLTTDSNNKTPKKEFVCETHSLSSLFSQLVMDWEILNTDSHVYPTGGSIFMAISTHVRESRYCESTT